ESPEDVHLGYLPAPGAPDIADLLRGIHVASLGTRQDGHLLFGRGHDLAPLDMVVDVTLYIVRGLDKGNLIFIKKNSHLLRGVPQGSQPFELLYLLFREVYKMQRFFHALRLLVPQS